MGRLFFFATPYRLTRTSAHAHLPSTEKEEARQKYFENLGGSLPLFDLQLDFSEVFIRVVWFLSQFRTYVCAISTTCVVFKNV